jgi:endonuclease/exonuclease/phosphatase (EEP) superfamily protein YafD
MSFLQRVLFYVSLVIGTLLILVSLGSLISNTTIWFLQILNFPRVEVLLGLVVGLLLFLLCRKKWGIMNLLFLTGMLVSIGIQACILFPYTPLGSRPVRSANPVSVNKETIFSIMLANVLITNDRSDELVKIVTDKEPTFLLTMEINKRWLDQLSVLTRKYPYRMIFPSDNAYGMALYSKLPFHNQQILFLNFDRVPTFKATFTLPSGRSFQLITIHPVAPTPSKYPDITDRKKEVALLKAGRMVGKRSLPTVVAGDFNDVGWSYNTHQFVALSGLNDVRYGRGLYSTFNAQSMFLRWPLDYVFVSSEFRVLAVERLPAFGSDHFPFYVQLSLTP